MSDMNKFFALTASHQIQLRVLIALLAVSNLIQALLSISATGSLSPLITVVVNVAVLYCTAFIQKAPDFYFRLIFWLVVFVLIFDGAALVTWLSSRAALTPRTVLNLVDVVSVGVFSRSILALRAVSVARPKQ